MPAGEPRALYRFQEQGEDAWWRWWRARLWWLQGDGRFPHALARPEMGYSEPESKPLGER